MRILFILLGSFSILYFIGIVLYAGLSSLFPCIWAAAGIVCYAIAILLRLETTHHWNILSIVGAAASKTQAKRCGCWVPQPGLVCECETERLDEG